MEKKENPIFKWLKKITVGQAISILISIVTGAIGFGSYYISKKSYEDSKNGELSIELYNPDTEEVVDIKESSSICVLFFRDYNADIEFISFDKKHAVYIPHLSNKSSNALNNFHCKISVSSSAALEKNPWYSEEEEDEDEKEYKIEEMINPKYSFVVKERGFLETEDHNFELEYKENILRAHEILPIPIKEVEISEEGLARYNLKYEITYDGLENPLNLSVEFQAFNGKINKRFMEAYLSNLLLYIDEDEVKNNNVTMIYSDENVFSIIKDNNILLKDQFDNFPFYQYISKLKGF